MASLADILTFTSTTRVEEEARAYATIPVWQSSRKSLALFYGAATALCAGLPPDMPGALSADRGGDVLAAMAVLVLAVFVWRGNTHAMWLAAALFIGTKGLAAVQAQTVGRDVGLLAVFLASAAYVLTAYALRVEWARRRLGPPLLPPAPPTMVEAAPQTSPRPRYDLANWGRGRRGKGKKK